MNHSTRLTFFSLAFGLVISCCPALSATADHPFQGDYAGRYTFEPTQDGATGATQGLLVIAIAADGRFSASYINKTTDINYHVRGTIDTNGQFEGKVIFAGKEWGSHRGTFSKARNGSIKGRLEETPNDRAKSWGIYKIVGGTDFGGSR